MGFLNHEQYQSCDTSCSLENDLERSADLSQLSNEKKTWLFRVFFRDYTSQLCGKKTLNQFEDLSFASSISMASFRQKIL